MAKELKFVYCECGCHGYEGGAGSNSFWIFYHLDERTFAFDLHHGHGWISPKIGSYSTLKEAATEATKKFKEALAALKKCLK